MQIIMNQYYKKRLDGLFRLQPINPKSKKNPEEKVDEPCAPLVNNNVNSPSVIRSTKYGSFPILTPLPDGRLKRFPDSLYNLQHDTEQVTSL